MKRKVLLTTIRKVLNYLWPDCEKSGETVVKDNDELSFVWHNLCPDTSKMTDDDLVDLLRDLITYELV